MPIERESPLRVTLLQALARGEKMDWVLQKATELGVARIVPVATERSVVQLDGERAGRRLEHWQGIVASACEQCGRNRLPEVLAPQSLAAACQLAATSPASVRLVLAPGATASLAAAASAAEAGASEVALLIGPEGGLSEAELRVAAQAGFVAVAMGPRVLRTETASIAALAVLQLVAGDFGELSRRPGGGRAAARRPGRRQAATLVSCAIIDSSRSTSGTSGVSLIMRSWHRAGQRSGIARELSGRTTSVVTRSTCGKPCETIAK